jgi:hypothetical protein
VLAHDESGNKHPVSPKLLTKNLLQTKQANGSSNAAAKISRNCFHTTNADLRDRVARQALSLVSANPRLADRMDAREGACRGNPERRQAGGRGAASNLFVRIPK